MKKKINFSPVSDNSSSEDAMIAFAKGASIPVAKAMVWDPKVKAIFSQLRQLPVHNARRRAKYWCDKNFVSY